MSITKKIESEVTMVQARLTKAQMKELRFIGRKRGLLDPRGTGKEPNKAQVLRTLIEEEARRLRKK